MTTPREAISAIQDKRVELMRAIDAIISECVVDDMPYSFALLCGVKDVGGVQMCLVSTSPPAFVADMCRKVVERVEARGNDDVIEEVHREH